MNDDRDQGPPLPIDYYSANAPHDDRAASDRPRESTGTWAGTFFLILGWIPFTCGLLSGDRLSVHAPRPWLEAESNGVVLMMAFGVVSTVCATLAYLRRGHAAHAAVAAFSVLVQLGVAMCVRGFR
jgi:hypothetical protein